MDENDVSFFFINQDKSFEKRKRTELDIDIDILNNLLQNNSNVKLTRLQSEVYLCWNTFLIHLDNLRKKGLIKKESLELTEKGIEMLNLYKKNIYPFLKKYKYI